MSKRPILVVDGLNLFMRHFVVNPTMSETGEHVGGVVGFLKSLRLLSDRIGPSQIIVAWEGGGSTRRRAIFPQYKQGRRPQKLNRYYSGEIPDTVQNRDCQITQIINLLKNCPVKQIYVDECEADDIIGYYVKYKLEGKRAVIVSSDKDMHQLLTKDILQWSPGQKRFISISDVREKFGISVTNFCTARCFVGDSSDGLPGVPKVGFASLSKRFLKMREDDFVSVDEIIKEASGLVENSKLKIYTSIIENQEIARTNWKLMYLDMKNLSYSQIEKIDFALESETPNGNKIALIRALFQSGIKNFDVDGFYVSLIANLKRG
jgi:5'-3' exonuclease